MARIDKVVQIVRGIAGTVFPGSTVTPVRFSAGSVVIAGTAAGTNPEGVVCPGGTIQAGEAIGVLMRGEIVEFGGSASTIYYGGSVMGTVSTNAAKVGVTVEANRLVVKM